MHDFFSFSRPAREAATAIPCRECAERLVARRSCRCAYLSCPGCGRRFEITDYREHLDELEEFLSHSHCDRI